MEIKINQEIKEYNETIFFGLSLRQFIYTVLACIFAIAVYFFTKDRFSMEMVSWLCMLSAVPFLCLGYIKYHGMTAWETLKTIVRFTLFTKRIYICKGEKEYVVSK